MSGCEGVEYAPIANARSNAAKDGRARYFTGRPCKRGHIAERFVSNGRCVECARDDRLKNGRKTRQSYAYARSQYDMYKRMVDAHEGKGAAVMRSRMRFWQRKMVERAPRETAVGMACTEVQA